MELTVNNPLLFPDNENTSDERFPRVLDFGLLTPIVPTNAPMDESSETLKINGSPINAGALIITGLITKDILVVTFELESNTEPAVSFGGDNRVRVRVRVF